MSGKRYPEEFKIEAVKQVVERGHSVSSVATRLDITTHSLYARIKKYGPDSSTHNEQSDAQAEIHEGWLYLAVVVDLFSRKVIGWSMQPRMTKEIVLNALLMAVLRRNPQKQVLVHSDQGSQYTSHEWQSFLKSHGLEGSMSRRCNCHDNAVAEAVPALALTGKCWSKNGCKLMHLMHVELKYEKIASKWHNKTCILSAGLVA